MPYKLDRLDPWSVLLAGRIVKVVSSPCKSVCHPLSVLSKTGMASLPAKPVECLGGRHRSATMLARHDSSWAHRPGRILLQPGRRDRIPSANVGCESRPSDFRRRVPHFYPLRHDEWKSSTATLSRVFRCSSSSFGQPSVMAADGGILYHQATSVSPQMQ